MLRVVKICKRMLRMLKEAEDAKGCIRFMQRKLAIGRGKYLYFLIYKRLSKIWFLSCFYVCVVSR